MATIFLVGVQRVVRTRPPAATDYQFSVGTIWYDETNEKGYVLYGNGVNTAQWYEVGSVPLTPGALSMVADVAITRGQLVRVNSTGHAALADASSEEGSRVVGFALDTVAIGESLDVLDGGTLIDATQFAFSADEIGKVVYASTTTAGAITSEPAPPVNGNQIVPVGRVLSNTKIRVNIPVA